MKRLWIAGLLACTITAGAFAEASAEHTYKKVASVQDLMGYMVKPAMDKIKVFREAGGPADKDQWQEAFGAISMVSEASQLVLMDGRVKDDAWRDGATKVMEAAQGAMLGAYRMDADGYNQGLKAMSAGCKTCHDVHKKKK